MLRRLSILALSLAGLLMAPAADAREMENNSTVVLRTIDKLSARTHTFDIPVDKTVKFGTSLFIKARACRKSSPLDQPESAAFLQIWERKPTEQASHWVFSGWMFASNPSLSYMDHPIYDVWVIECKNATTVAKAASEEFSSEKAPEHALDKDAVAPASADKSAAATTPALGATASTQPADAVVSKPASGKPAEIKPADVSPAATAVPVDAAKHASPAPVDDEKSFTDKSLEDTVPVPAGEIAPENKPAPAPAIDQLPGSFEDGGGDDANLPED